ncbi:MAG: rhomboid family intramembrane serine protease [Flavobacteriales bacterium]|nr:rhomboid family intramembrane serine protease [Flavobacteriales bacterium]
MYLKPEPESLKEKSFSLTQNYRQIRVSLYGGILLLTIFLFTSNFQFEEMNERAFELLALSNVWEFAYRWPYQFFTHHFVHFNLYHLVANIFFLMLLTAYERRVGAIRFLEVAAASAIFSTPSVFILSGNSATCGISAVLFGLGAAYFTDHKQLSKKEWLKAVGLFSLIAILMTIGGELETDEDEMIVDHWGHILGAVGGIIYCRIRQPKPPPAIIEPTESEESIEPEMSKETDYIATAIDKLRYSGNVAAADGLRNAKLGGSTGGEIVSRIGFFFMDLKEDDSPTFEIVKEEAQLFFKEYAAYFTTENPEGRESVVIVNPFKPSETENED